ncbi:DNA-polymerase delta, subunit 4 [Sesbania bispinosa]|nr:DNA-polymerase delta, subunit 4 [Sesbania bispinosa]
MSSVSGNMKGFYRQRKNTNKPSNKKQPPIHAATFGSGVAQPPALISRGGEPDLQDECNDNEALLRQFDLNMAYGPCLGMTRLARWERAQKLGLNPPQEIERLLKSGKVQAESLWDGRI